MVNIYGYIEFCIHTKFYLFDFLLRSQRDEILKATDKYMLVDFPITNWYDKIGANAKKMKMP